jgi:hypothetical protein
VCSRLNAVEFIFQELFHHVRPNIFELGFTGVCDQGKQGIPQEVFLAILRYLNGQQDDS